MYPRTTPTGLHLARPIRVLRDHDVIGLTIAATHHPLTLVAPAPEPPRPWSIPGVSYRVAEGASAALAERARGRQQPERDEDGQSGRLQDQARADGACFLELVVHRDPVPGPRQQRRRSQPADPRPGNADRKRVSRLFS